MQASGDFEQAMAHYHAGAYAEAAALFALAPDDAVALRMLGICRVRLGDTEVGLGLLGRAAALTPQDGQAALLLGIGLLTAGQAARAVPQFRRAQALLPWDPAPPLNLASALLTVGDLPGARAAARKARLRGPKLPETHYTAGLASLACGNLDAAALAFEKAIALAQHFAEAWLNLGVTRYRLGNIAGARAAMERALAAQPDLAAARANLAVFDRLSGDNDSAAARLAAILKRDPANAEARLNRASMLLGDDREAEALALLEAEPPSGGAAGLHWRLQHALALLRLNRTAEAAAVLDSLGPVPRAFAPLLEFRRVLLALGQGQPGLARQHAETMQQQLRATPGMLPEHRLMGWYDLGRYWRRAGEPGLAFDAWAEGHRELARFQPFSRDAYAAFQAATIDAYSHARLHSGARASNRDPAPVFIVGMPRSGTTLAEQILAAHADVHGAGERPALAVAFHAAGGGWESPEAARRAAALGTEGLDRVAEPYLAALHALAPGKARVLDKMPGNFRLLGFAATLLPGARAIYCARDPRDIGASIFQYRFFGYHPYAHDLGDLGWYIAQQRALMEHWRAVLPIPLLTVHLTDWVEDFGGTLRRVLEFLGLPYDSACERFYENTREVRTVSRQQVRAPVNSQGIGRWRPYADRLGPLLAALEAGGFTAPETPRSPPP